MRVQSVGMYRLPSDLIIVSFLFFLVAVGGFLLPTAGGFLFVGSPEPNQQLFIFPSFGFGVLIIVPPAMMELPTKARPVAGGMSMDWHTVTVLSRRAKAIRVRP